MSTHEMKMWAVVERPVHDVWTALTTREGVEGWLAKEAIVEAREGGRYRLRSGTPLCTGEHVVRHLEPDARLELDWEVLGERTQVELRLEPKDGGTRIDVAHRHSNAASLHADKACPDVSSMFAELWTYNMALLKTYLELGEAKARLDPDRAPSTEVRHVVHVAARPEDVFALIDDPVQVRNWNAFVGESAANDRRVGGTYSFGWESEKKQTDGPHEITEYEAGRRITYRWYGKPPTLVSWTVEPLPGSPNATKLTLTHSGFDIDRNMLVGWNLGWAAFLGQLVLHAERRTAPTWLGM